FKELAKTSEKYFIPYIMQCHDINEDISVLEIGCGEGGNLLPFARLGCYTSGVDISETRIKEAKRFFTQENLHGTFICDNIFNITEYNRRFDIIICHDVIEHIADKQALLDTARSFIKDDGVLFIAFPAWQMPFGGHQQISRNRLLSRTPFIHLLPHKIYKHILNRAGESAETIKELLSIRSTSITIERFEKIIFQWNIADRSLYLINPHYETKYGLTPRKIPDYISKIPYIRNYISTSCFYLLKPMRN
ncbi:MAG: class I SAM-dependent methyltransferase, partial [Lachnospiraceae bacterium]|nr:class I SAM-dependent methyltransferase [Lachnospiraceae bacterium]